MSLSGLMRTLFSIDARSLVFARVSTGFLLLVDLLLRVSTISIFLTSSGIAPRPGFIAGGIATWSLHTLFDSSAWVGFLFFIHAICAISMMLGYRARVATAASFFLYVSLCHATPTYSPGQSILTLLLFFGFFLNWGSPIVRGVFSISSKLIYSPWTCAALIHIGMIEFFAGLHKSGATWLHGIAGAYAAASYGAGTSFGEFAVHTMPALILAGTYLVVLLQVTSPLYLFSPYKTAQMRAVMLIILECMHLTFGLFLRIGWFPYITVVALTLFAPSQTWDAIEHAIAFVRSQFGWSLKRDGPMRPEVHRIDSDWTWINIFGALIITILFLVWHSHNLILTTRGVSLRSAEALSRPLAGIFDTIGMRQSWALFAPNVTLVRAWPIVIVVDAEGATYDVRTGVSPTWDSEEAREAYGPLLWMNLYTELYFSHSRAINSGSPLTHSLLAYYCHQPLPSGASGHPVGAAVYFASVDSEGVITKEEFDHIECVQ